MSGPDREGASLCITDLMNRNALADAIRDGLVRVQEHPSEPLRIFNYTEKAVFARQWDAVTTQCRGLIADAEGRIVARPFPKFFNYGEHPDGALDLAAPAEVTDKLDGSLGILYPSADGWSIATRGSFVSEQAQHATKLFRDIYDPAWTPPRGLTCLFEIIYRGNRIVCDYGDADDLFLLGAVDIQTGKTYGPEAFPHYPGPVAHTFSASTLADALALAPRPGAEGVVVRLVDSDLRVKIKQDDYVALHKLVTGMNARAVWERIADGQGVDEICMGLPEEFWPWVREVGGELLAERARILADSRTAHERILAALPPGWGRKDYALAAQKSPLRAWLFMLLDDRDPSAKIWRTLRPSGERALVSHSEDVA